MLLVAFKDIAVVAVRLGKKTVGLYRADTPNRRADSKNDFQDLKGFEKHKGLCSQAFRGDSGEIGEDQGGD